MKYIDVSKWQGNIDFAKVAKEVDGVIIRAGYGENNIDGYFKMNAAGCAANNIPFGVYWFSYAISAAEARKEAQYCLAAIKPYRVELPVCFDFENASVEEAERNGVSVNKTLATEIAQAFCEEIEKAGYYVVVYTNENFRKFYFKPSLFDKYEMWYARYTDKLDSVPNNCGIWQYTNSGKINGISGNVDINIAYHDHRALITQRGLNNLSSAENKAWYADAQEWAIKNNITDGSRPTEAATRAEVWAMLQRMNRGN